MHPFLRAYEVTVIPIVELALNGPGMLIPAFEAYCARNRLKCIPYRGTKDNRLGLPATHAVQAKSVETMRVLLRTPGAIRIASGFQSVGRKAIYPHLNSESPASVLGKLAKQLESVRYDAAKNKYTGKMGDFFQDDIAMAFLNGIYVDGVIQDHRTRL